MDFKEKIKAYDAPNKEAPRWKWLGKDDPFSFGLRVNKKGAELLKENLEKALVDLEKTAKISSLNYIKCESQTDINENPIKIHGFESIKFDPPLQENSIFFLTNVFKIIFILGAFGLILILIFAFFTGIYAFGLDILHFFQN